MSGLENGFARCVAEMSDRIAAWRTVSGTRAGIVRRFDGAVPQNHGFLPHRSGNYGIFNAALLGFLTRLPFIAGLMSSKPPAILLHG